MSSPVSDDGYRALLIDPSTVLDVPHHDVPERHQIGGTLLAPVMITSFGAGTSTPGRSPAPAREDHVHGLDPTTFPGPLGRVVVGTVLPGPITVPSGNVDLTNSFTYTFLTYRVYRFVFSARAIGPTTNGTQCAVSFQTAGSTSPLFDHWFTGNNQWGNVNISVIMPPGWGGSMTFKMTAVARLNSTNVYPTEFYAEDIGKV